MCPYQPFQACASSSGGRFLWVVGSKAGVEHIRSTTGRPLDFCKFWLATALENLQLQRHGHTAGSSLNGYGCRKIRENMLFYFKGFLTHSPHTTGVTVLCDKAEVTTLISQRVKSCGRSYLGWKGLVFTGFGGNSAHIVKPSTKLHLLNERANRPLSSEWELASKSV